MYCRKCGKKIDDRATECPYCYTKVVYVPQRAYADKYNEQRKKEKELASSTENEAVTKNQYYKPAIWFTFIAFILSLIPWPVSWKVGTSVWMKILLLFLAICADYYNVRARKTANYYVKMNARNRMPGILKSTYFLAVLTTLMVTFTMFMSFGN